MCTSACMITSEAIINVFWKFFQMNVDFTLWGKQCSFPKLHYLCNFKKYLISNQETYRCHNYYNSHIGHDSIQILHLCPWFFKSLCVSINLYLLSWHNSLYKYRLKNETKKEYVLLFTQTLHKVTDKYVDNDFADSNAKSLEIVWSKNIYSRPKLRY